MLSTARLLARGRWVAIALVPVLIVTHAGAARAPHEASCRIFPASNPLNQDISHARVDPNSARYIASIGAHGHLHPDFGTNPGYGIPYVVVPPDQPRVAIDFTEFGQESNPGPYPVPLDAPVEGAGEAGDRHVLVLQTGRCKLYELSRATHGCAEI